MVEREDTAMKPIYLWVFLATNQNNLGVGTGKIISLAGSILAVATNYLKTNYEKKSKIPNRNSIYGLRNNSRFPLFFL